MNTEHVINYNEASTHRLLNSTLTEEEFAREDLSLGKSVHFKGEVWWIQDAPLYCKPVFPFRLIETGDVRPKLSKSLLGYSHRVPDGSQFNHTLRWNVLQGEALRRFSLESLPSAKRRTVRQGLRNCRVQYLSDIRPHLNSLTAIAKSQAHKHQNQGGAIRVLAPEKYESEPGVWQETILNVSKHKGHNFFGVFCGDDLIAYADLIQVEDTWLIGTVKAHQEMLQFRPVDALYFAILQLASQSGTCFKLVNGGGNEREGTTRFKKQFRFESVTYRYFRRIRIPLLLASRLRRLARQ